MRVECIVTEVELENEEGRIVPGVQAECTSCGHITESFGTGQDSIRRCLALMREECPMGENNFYIQEE